MNLDDFTTHAKVNRVLRPFGFELARYGSRKEGHYFRFVQTGRDIDRFAAAEEWQQSHEWFGTFDAFDHYSPNDWAHTVREFLAAMLNHPNL